MDYEDDVFNETKLFDARLLHTIFILLRGYIDDIDYNKVEPLLTFLITYGSIFSRLTLFKADYSVVSRSFEITMEIRHYTMFYEKAYKYLVIFTKALCVFSKAEESTYINTLVVVVFLPLFLITQFVGFNFIRFNRLLL